MPIDLTQINLPDPRFRSPGAVAGVSDVRDDHIYSSIVVGGGGTGTQNVFTVPQGQSIPTLAGAVTVASHQSTYSDLTTNLTQAGQFGSAIGEAAIYSLGLTFEQAGYTLATGAARTYGMTPFEMAECASKLHFQLKIAGKKYSEGPVFVFPSAGAIQGSVSTTGNSITVGVTTNGAPGLARRLKYAIPVARTDQVQGVFTVGNGASLTFSTATQPSLIWVVLKAVIAGDAR